MKKTLVEETIVLKKFEKLTVEPGQVSFPFSFNIPSDLPSSLFFMGVDSSRMEIQYKVIAKMEEPVINEK